MNRYYSFEQYVKQTYGGKLYKIALDAGMTCPNRDGTLGHHGCIFCKDGSGTHATRISCHHPSDLPPIQPMIEEGIASLRHKHPNGKWIAYFQAYTNTYASTDYLYAIYSEALQHEQVQGISIATRPDCLPLPVLDTLCKLQSEHPYKFIWIELGLQTIHPASANYLRLGYSLEDFTNSCQLLAQRDIPIIAHCILGLPGETLPDALCTIAYLNNLPISGIKLQLLHVLIGTDLARDYEQGNFQTLSQEEYITWLLTCIEHLREDIVIHRLTGDGDRNDLIAPTWSLHKRAVRNAIHHAMAIHNTLQGRNYHND